eukprot:1156221-Pelagomonas_calceolata.AAC.11
MISKEAIVLDREMFDRGDSDNFGISEGPLADKGPATGDCVAILIDQHNAHPESGFLRHQLTWKLLNLSVLLTTTN